jgi:hypothetical protein
MITREEIENEPAGERMNDWIGKYVMRDVGSYPYSTDMSLALEIAKKFQESQAYPIEIKGDTWYDGTGWWVNIYDVLGTVIEYAAKDELLYHTEDPRLEASLPLVLCRIALMVEFKYKKDKKQ